ncbi:hypothetical protein [Clavibacter zhangzhiyongii]
MPPPFATTTALGLDGVFGAVLSTGMATDAVAAAEDPTALTAVTW